VSFIDQSQKRFKPNDCDYEEDTEDEEIEMVVGNFLSQMSKGKSEEMIIEGSQMPERMGKRHFQGSFGKNQCQEKKTNSQKVEKKEEDFLLGTFGKTEIGPFSQNTFGSNFTFDKRDSNKRPEGLGLDFHMRQKGNLMSFGNAPHIENKPNGSMMDLEGRKENESQFSIFSSQGFFPKIGEAQKIESSFGHIKKKLNFSEDLNGGKFDKNF
jgi:hypothetical protein